MPDPRSAGAYTASDNALHGRGSVHGRLVQKHIMTVNTIMIVLNVINSIV